MDVTKVLESIENFSTQAMSAIGNTFDKLGITDPNIGETRMITCVVCPYYTARTSKCESCGCYLPIKTKLIASKCPESKW